MSKLRILSKSLTCALAASALLLGLNPPAQAGMQAHLAPYSKDTQGLFVVKIEPSKWAQALKDQTDLKDLIEQVNQQIQQNLGEGSFWDLLMNLGEHLSLAYQPWAEQPVLMFNLDLRSGARAEALLQRVYTQEQQGQGEGSMTLRHFGPQAYYSVSLDQDDELLQELELAVVGNHIYGTVGSAAGAPARLKNMLYLQAVIAPESALKLANQKLFKPVRQQFKNEDFWAYADLQNLLPLMQDEKLAESLGLKGLDANSPALQDVLHYYRGLGLGLNTEGHKTSVSAYLSHDLPHLTPFQRQYLQDHLPGKPSQQVQAELLAKIPQDAVLLGSGGHLKAYLQTPIPTDAKWPEAASNLMQGPERMQAFAKALNLDLEQDVLPALNGGSAFALFWDQHRMMPQVAMLLGLQPERAEAFEQTLSQKLELNFDFLAEKGESIEQRAKTSMVKANMYTLQTIVETYGVDYGGVYPADISTLKTVASDPEAYPYWHDFKNPLTREAGLGKSLRDYAEFQADPAQVGTVYYEGRGSKGPDGQFEAYVIYGYGLDGKLYALTGDDDMGLVNLEPKSALPVLKNDLPKPLPQAPAQPPHPQFLSEYHGSRMYRLPMDAEFAQAMDFGAAVQRAKLSSLKANMFTLQTIVETYGVDSGGTYANSIKTLKTAAEDESQGTSAYWMDFSNPMTEQKGLGQSVADYSALKRDGSQVGMVFYAPRSPESDDKGQTSYTHYVIYGYGSDGQLYALSDDPSQIQSLDSDASLPVVEKNLKVADSEPQGPYLDPVFARQGNILVLAQTPEILKRILDQKPHSHALVQRWQTQTGANQESHFLFNLQNLKPRLEKLAQDMDEEDAKLFGPLMNNLAQSQGLYSFVREEPAGSLWKLILDLDLSQVPWDELIKPNLDTDAHDEALTAPALDGSESEQAQNYSVMANMHTVQTMVEIYGVDYGGVYPSELKTLEMAAKDTTQGTSPYWKELTNPYTQESGPDATLMKYKDYSPDPKYKGRVLYAPDAQDDTPTKYWIYGTDGEGKLLTRKKQVFVLSNS